MKQILTAILFVLVVGTIGFVYRYELEKPRPVVGGPGGQSAGDGQACTQEAKVCPDGSAVGRTGPNCSFAACPPPNIELTTGSTTIDFVLPSGYKADSANTNGATLLATFTQTTTDSSASSTNSASTISVHAYPLSAGQSPSQVMISQTTIDASGLQATSTSEFKTIAEGGNTFYEILIGRSEGQVQTAYYIYEPTEVLRFDITERGVQNWTDPTLNPDTLPQHQALLQMLATLQI